MCSEREAVAHRVFITRRRVSQNTWHPLSLTAAVLGTQVYGDHQDEMGIVGYFPSNLVREQRVYQEATKEIPTTVSISRWLEDDSDLGIRKEYVLPFPVFAAQNGPTVTFMSLVTCRMDILTSALWGWHTFFKHYNCSELIFLSVSTFENCILSLLGI